MKRSLRWYDYRLASPSMPWTESGKARTRLRKRRVVTPASWVGVAICLAAYLFGTGTQFDIANALLFPIVAAPALLARAYPSAFISCAFGVIGALHLCGVAV